MIILNDTSKSFLSIIIFQKMMQSLKIFYALLFYTITGHMHLISYSKSGRFLLIKHQSQFSDDELNEVNCHFRIDKESGHPTVNCHLMS